MSTVHRKTPSTVIIFSTWRSPALVLFVNIAKTYRISILQNTWLVITILNKNHVWFWAISGNQVSVNNSKFGRDAWLMSVFRNSGIKVLFSQKYWCLGLIFVNPTEAKFYGPQHPYPNWSKTGLLFKQKMTVEKSVEFSKWNSNLFILLQSATKF